MTGWVDSWRAQDGRVVGTDRTSQWEFGRSDGQAPDELTWSDEPRTTRTAQSQNLSSRRLAGPGLTWTRKSDRTSKRPGRSDKSDDSPGKAQKWRRTTWTWKCPVRRSSPDGLDKDKMTSWRRYGTGRSALTVQLSWSGPAGQQINTANGWSS